MDEEAWKRIKMREMGVRQMSHIKVTIAFLEYNM